MPGIILEFTSPNPNDIFTITSNPAWPCIIFKTDCAGPHTWNWTICWKTFSQSGTDTTDGSDWDAQNAVANRGGTLTVQASAAGESATLTVKILGQNPAVTQVGDFFSGKADCDGFDKILAHESRMMHFDEKGEPVKSFDNGYGMAQLTKPAPTFEQVWNWKLNINAGLKLYSEKRAAAVRYLTQQGRKCTANQLKYETACRWNGGSYHTWDASKGWVRNACVLCDTQTGNIGWDMTDPENKGKTEQQLRERDKSTYSRGRRPGDHWRYFGVCYADCILG